MISNHTVQAVNVTDSDCSFSATPTRGHLDPVVQLTRRHDRGIVRQLRLRRVRVVHVVHEEVLKIEWRTLGIGRIDGHHLGHVATEVELGRRRLALEVVPVWHVRGGQTAPLHRRAHLCRRREPEALMHIRRHREVLQPSAPRCGRFVALVLLRLLLRAAVAVAVAVATPNCV